jgi:hypothetical protein
MIWIRVFLWTLIGLMTIQGFLHADEYGGEASFLSGIGLTMSIWGERFQGILTRTVKLPRAFVIAALQETARHPHVHGGVAFREFQTSINAFQERELAWMLQHVSLLGDPEGARTLHHWFTMENATQQELEVARAAECTFPLLHPRPCALAVVRIRHLEANLSRITRVQAAWSNILYLGDVPSNVEDWWRSISGSGYTEFFTEFQSGVRNLFNVTDPGDARVTHTLTLLDQIRGSWSHRLLRSLAEGSLWKHCIAYIRRREERFRELLMSSGLHELFTAQDRVLNASLRLSPAGSTREIQTWFSELMAHNWWPSDALPPIVRRCLHQETGDCTRIGAAEIAALTAQIGEKKRIAEDWARRLFIGMWNALPAVGVLFVLECIVLCLQKPRAKLRRHYGRTTYITAERYGASGYGRHQEEVPQRLDAGDRGPDGHVGGPRRLLPVDA